MAGELIEIAQGVSQSLDGLPSLGMREGGKIVLTVLFKRYVDDLFERLKKAKADKQVDEGFDQTVHGKTLIEEALNGLWQARDQERAKAIQQVFLGLAMNPVQESLAQVEQLQAIRTAAEMTTWEVVLCNALERYSKVAFQKTLADSYGPWEKASQITDRAYMTELQGLIQASVPRFRKWLEEDFCDNYPPAITSLQRAADSLNQKMVLRVPYSGLEENQTWSALDKRGAFSEFGWKLAQYLYAAEVPAEVEAK